MSHWELVGIGWANQGEAWFADWQRLRRAEERKVYNEDRYEGRLEPFA